MFQILNLYFKIFLNAFELSKPRLDNLETLPL
jgi:hypothetical protein